MAHDPRTLAAAQLHDQLRTLLLRRFDQTPPDLLAAALSYELASVVAASAETVADAILLVQYFADVQVDQIRRLGVGHPHP